MNIFEKIAYDAYGDELANLYAMSASSQEEQPDESSMQIDNSPRYELGLAGSAATGAGLMAAIGALRNRFSSLPMSHSLGKNIIAGGLLGLGSLGTNLIIDKIKAARNAANLNIAAMPLEAQVFGE